jgi:hypothetical protein
MHFRHRVTAAAAALLALISSSACVSAQVTADWLPIAVETAQQRVVITADGEPFAEYDYASYSRPILYPVYGPGQVALTRHWPMRDDVPGEAHDHPHHKSMWFAHGDVDGLDFWSEKAAIHNSEVTLRTANDRGWPGLVAANEWLGNGGTVCRETATILFAAKPDVRFIDCQYQLASEREVVFGDTKEGTFALRTHPALILKQTEGGPAPGHA